MKKYILIILTMFSLSAQARVAADLVTLVLEVKEYGANFPIVSDYGDVTPKNIVRIYNDGTIKATNHDVKNYEFDVEELIVVGELSAADMKNLRKYLADAKGKKLVAPDSRKPICLAIPTTRAVATAFYPKQGGKVTRQIVMQASYPCGRSMYPDMENGKQLSFEILQLLRNLN